MQRIGPRASTTSFLLALLLPLLAVPGLGGQEPANPPAPAAAGSARVGLALSGGAARGLAHIGVLRVLEEEGIPIHVVAGTSMGSIIGAMYAVGYSVAEIDSLARAVRWDDLFDDPAMQPRLAPGENLARPPFAVSVRVQGGEVGLPIGLVAGREIGLTLSRLLWPAGGETDFRRLPVPFATVATDLDTGERVVLEEGSLRRAIRASMSLPLVFEPMRWEGRRLIDGGITQNLPATETLALGAELLVCSDMTEPLAPLGASPSLTDVIEQTIVFQVHTPLQEQRALCDVLIQIGEDELGAFAFDRIDSWIEVGEAAAREALPRLRRLAAGAAPAPRREMLLRPGDSIRVTRIEVEAEDERIERSVRTIVGAELPRHVTAANAAALANRIRDAFRFSRVGYRLDAAGADTALVFELEGRPAAELGFLFRYDDWWGAALLFAATFHDRVRFGSELHLDLRLGEQLLLRSRYLQDGTARVPYDLAAEARYIRAPLYEFDGGTRAAELRHVSLGGWGYVGWRVDRTTGLGLQLKAERNQLARAVAEHDSASTRGLVSLSLLGRRTTLEPGLLGRRGGSILIRSEWGLGAIVGESFSHHLLDVTRAFPLGERSAVRARFLAGASAGAGVPADRRFYLGGIYPGMVLPEVQIPFAAIEPQQRSGRAVQLVTLSANWWAREGFVVGVNGSAGNAFEEWRWWGAPDYLFGAGVTGAVTTRLGDVRVDVAGRNLSGWPRVAVQLGSVF